MCPTKIQPLLKEKLINLQIKFRETHDMLKCCNVTLFLKDESIFTFLESTNSTMTALVCLELKGSFLNPFTSSPLL